MPRARLEQHPFPVGAPAPPHLHTREDEYSIVTDGEIGFRSGDRDAALGPGGYITEPRGELHTMWNAGPTPARMIEIISPAGSEHFFREQAEVLADGPPQTKDAVPPQPEDAVPALATEYGIGFGRPARLPDVVSRFDLTPPPAP
ncbi:cupin domain-containing protein [Kitasatospora griseola]|uniref:cupin domain-containing protein n=1 Tax=Kitasatospora griseola TaxID=2064 RepID=UPI00380A6D19